MIDPLAELQRMIGSVRSADPAPVDYMVLDPAVSSGTHTEGRDALGKRYVRVPATALDGLGMPKRPTPDANVLGAVRGIDVYRREDLPSGWPDWWPPLPVSGSGYARKPITAAELEAGRGPRRKRGGPWYDQLTAIARAPEHGSLRLAFGAYRDLLDGSGIDPYREPMFDRVFARAERDGTTFGLQFEDKVMEGFLHRDAGEGAGGWPAVRRMLCEDVADRLFDEVGTEP